MRPHRPPTVEAIIAVSDPEMMQLWADRFGVDLEDLDRAIGAVGPGVDQLQEELTGIPPLPH